MIPRRIALIGALALAACDGGPVETVQIPPGALPGAGNALAQATEAAHHMLVARPDALLDRPADAAYALMLYEIATVEAAAGRLADPWPGRLMREARPVVRAAAGIASEATAQQVVDALWAASQALRRDDEPGARAALVPPAVLYTEIARDRLQRYTLPAQGGRALRSLKAALEREAGPPR
ncbi:hypothetical protein [Elioraea sp.]|jgi:hypothetical protein|uniref:hypothetical protein n=1 Tax=Elioraea sp. TaxID=2185103 RepID=UPI0021DD49E8|nr:hypothetical protein [Elioraea sp.]GIX10623.1 MAG: hypothetical protein KatS3mg116_2333 [Elioraea sp.]